MESLFSVIQELRLMFFNIPWQNIYYVARALFIFLDLILILGIIWLIPKALEFRPLFLYPKKSKKKKEYEKISVKNKWQDILSKAESAPPHSFTLAVVEADNFIDSILKELRIEGDTMADRLKQLNQNEIKSLANLWQAHRIRNEIIHTPGTELKSDDAKRFLNYYEDFLKEIGII